VITVGSLFAGIGGIELGLEWTGGFKTVWQVENDPYAIRVLQQHWPEVRRWKDVRTFPSEQRKTGGSCSDWCCDLICGGFPCQDISYAGKGAGLGGERSSLFYEAVRVIRVLEPRYVILENVEALLTRGLGAVLGALASLGYDAEWHCIPAASVGAPHIRDRIFVLAYASSIRLHGEWTAGQQKQIIRRTQTPSEGLRRYYTWSTEPNVGRVVDGVSARMDRLRCVGNAVVPQVAYWIGKRILQIDKIRLVQ